MIISKSQIIKFIKRNNFNFFIIYLFLFSIINFIFALNNKNYSADIDTEMYFGAMLLKGDLIYLKEFHDKLPIVQYLFSIPAFFKSTKAWVSLAYISTLLGSLTFYFNIKKIPSYDWSLNINKKINKLILLLSIIYIYALTSISSGLNQINILSANLILMSILFSLELSRIKQKKNNPKYFFYYISSTLLASLAISIRPYYFLPVIFLSLWWNIRGEYLNKSFLNNRKNTVTKLNSLKNIIIGSSKWLFLVIFFGIFINILPYILSQNLQAFIEGTSNNLKDLQNQSYLNIIYIQIAHILKLQDFSYLVAFALLIGVYTFYLKWKFKIKEKYFDCLDFDLIFGSLILSLSLELAFLSKHFWLHYFQLFIPLALISISISIFIISKLGSRINFLYLKKYKAIFILLICVGILSQDFIRSTKNIKEINLLSRNQIDLNMVNNFLKERDEKNLSVDFIFPENMYVHWKLNKERNGLPHYGNIKQIKKNKWKLLDFKISNYLSLPTNKNEYCEKLSQLDNSIIFTYKDSFESKCIKRTSSKYKKDISYINNDKRFEIFIKN